jgi:hypothetical protein
VHASGRVADDDAFGVEPGRQRVVRLRAEGGGQAADVGEAEPLTLTALNLAGRVRAR